MPPKLHILGATSYVMSSKGFYQYPDTERISADEYDDLINSPYDFLIEKVLPKIFTALNTDPVSRSLILAKAVLANMDYQSQIQKISQRIIDKYGFRTSIPGTVAHTNTPFDYIGDFLRGFKGIMADVRRQPGKVAEACEALLPVMVKRGLPPNPSRYGVTTVTLHLPTYLREKDFETIYWPTFSKLVNTLASYGQPCNCFCEDNWMRYLDYLYELPANTTLMFEYGDPKIIKDKLGTKHIIAGMYPLNLLKTGTGEQCIDKAKEMLDILAPGGRYIFGFDKGPLTLNEINIDNYLKVLEYVAMNSSYANYGEFTTGAARSSAAAEVQKADMSPELHLNSKYYVPVDQDDELKLEPYIKHVLRRYEDMLFNLLVRIS